MKDSIISELGDLERTILCGALSEKDIGKTHTIMGWVSTRRDLGGVIFLELRDKAGIMQVVVDRKSLPEEDFAKAEHIRSEFVVAVTGSIEKRAADTINEKLKTGTIDLRAHSLKILNVSKTPPFEIDDNTSVREKLRLKYRYLDLRRPKFYRNLKLRQIVLSYIREYLEEHDFLEVETPVLTKSTPEGARDFLVPSRLSPGNFYALPQSPQIYKQILMVAGMDKYYQIARCFRDEDLRADRQPEFTQVDMEMSFVSQEYILNMLQNLFKSVMKSVMGIDIPVPFTRLSYFESMERYGSDKPDLRFGMEMVDITDIAKVSGFKVFESAVNAGGIVKAITIKGGANLTRKQIEILTQKAVSLGGGGMAWVAINPDGSLQSVLTKYFADGKMQEIITRLGAENSDMIIFCADKRENVYRILGGLRLEIADMLGLRDPEKFKFCVIDKFPLLEYSPEEHRYIAMHHPFTMPLEEDMQYFDSDPLKIRAKSYDIVLNGVELGSGSIRIHTEELQKKIFDLLKIDDKTAKERFGFMLEAFEYGAPPHGGFAFGIDRFVMLLLGEPSIRETIAFPKTGDGSCLMSESPSSVSAAQLEELGLSLEGTNTSFSTVKKQTVDLNAVENAAALSKLALTGDEKDEMINSLSSILDFANTLSQLDTSNIEPLYQVIERKNILRDDNVKPPDDKENLMKNAAIVKDGCFFVPQIIKQ